MTAPLTNRWVQLLAGIVCMVMISSLQHGWTLFVHPINAKYEWGRAAIQVAFTVFILSETWLVPFEGWFVDKFGPLPVALLGGVLVAIAWGLNSVADSLPLLYLGAALGGIGAGCVYGTCLGNALKWFPDRRGLAAGLTVAGYGIGSALTIIPIHHTIEHHGYEAAFLWFGLGQGVLVCLAALALRKPQASTLAIPERLPHALHDHTPGEVASNYPATCTYMLGLTLPALTFALTFDRVTNGIARPLCGWLSDYIGRENTMFFAFTLGALSILAFARWGDEPVMFVLLVSLVFFAWGEVASLFPATCTDYFGSGYATTNAGMLHTAKGFAAMLVPLSDPLVRATGDWQIVFALAVGANAIAAVLGIAVLRPMRAAWLRRE